MADTLHKNLAKRLRQLRTDRGLTQERLAEKADLSADAIRRLERAGFSPTLRVINQLSGALGLPPSQLLKFDARLADREARLLALIHGRKDSELALLIRLAQAAFAAEVDP